MGMLLSRSVTLGLMVKILVADVKLPQPLAIASDYRRVCG
jgi:hypothetical protein